MIGRAIYTISTILMFAALGYGLGKTLQIIKAYNAGEISGTFLQAMTPTFIAVAIGVAIGLIGRWLVVRKLKK